MPDLADFHSPVSELFSTDTASATMLTTDQLDQYQRDGFLIGPRILNFEQLSALKDELTELTNPEHDGRELWYEYHSNEATDPGTVLFHLSPPMSDHVYTSGSARQSSAD